MNLSQAIVAYEFRLTDVVESILSQVVSSGTQGDYVYHNINLIFCMYEKEECREELLRVWLVEQLISDKKKRKKEYCATCKAALEEVNRSDANCPIVLE